jgi:4-amino-4-deoxy-L-arabinose transferase-like glycosyltransferase
MFRLEKSSYFPRLLLLLLCIKALMMLEIIVYGGIGLGPDEAQYWTWSRTLDWGYYSKPPGIAWQIWLGTQLFGHTELGVRFVSVLLSLAQAWGVYLVAIACELKPKAAFWCGMLMAFMPIGILGSLLAITDGGFLLFWILACLVMVSALTRDQEPNPILIGLTILGGALFKWPIYFFWIFFFLGRWRYFPQQSLSKGIAGIGLSVLGLFPSIWWNYSHDWATFRHVSATLQGGHAPVNQGGNLIEWIGSQSALLSPVLFVLLMIALWTWFKRYQHFSASLVFCGFVTISTLLGMTILATFQKIQGNWGLFAYPTGIILLGKYASEWQPKKMIWLKGGLGLSVFLAISSLLIPLSSFIPHKMNPFKHNLGWMTLQQQLKDLGYNPAQHFLVSDKYQTTSLLSFYNEGQKRAYFLNLNGTRKNQFSYWPGLHEEQKGRAGYFVWVENAPHLYQDGKNKMAYYENELKKYFEEVECLGLHPLLSQDHNILKGAFIFRCQNCRESLQPESSNLY